MISINELPNELLTKIFDSLDFESLENVSKVNNKWHKIALNSVKMDLIIEDNDAFETMDQKLLNKLNLKRIESQTFRTFIENVFNDWPKLFMQLFRPKNLLKINRNIIVLNVKSISNSNKFAVIRKVTEKLFLFRKNISNIHLFINGLSLEFIELIKDYEKSIKSIVWNHLNGSDKSLFIPLIETISGLTQLEVLVLNTCDDNDLRLVMSETSENAISGQYLDCLMNLSKLKNLVYFSINLSGIVVFFLIAFLYLFYRDFKDNEFWKTLYSLSDDCDITAENEKGKKTAQEIQEFVKELYSEGFSQYF
jgi:hypothetical protein